MSLSRARATIARCLDDQRGATAVEFGVCGAILILLSLGVTEVGRAFLVRNELAFAADRATRIVLMDRDAPDDTIIAAARSAFEEDTSLLAVSVDEETLDGLSSRVITLSYPVELVVPGLSGTIFNLTVSRRVSAEEE